SKVGLPEERIQQLNKSISKIKSVAKTIDYQFIYHQKLVWKRILDIFFGSIGFVGFMLVYPFVALGIHLSSDAPVIFKQKRAGFDGQEFEFYKFSSMHPQNEEDDNGDLDITEKEDNRIFAFGQFLRKTNLDELPQFMNVLK